MTYEGHVKMNSWYTIGECSTLSRLNGAVPGNNRNQRDKKRFRFFPIEGPQAVCPINSEEFGQITASLDYPGLYISLPKS